MAWQSLFKPKQGETVEMVKRRHPVTFLPQLFMFFLMLVLPLIVGRMIFEGKPIELANPLLHSGGILLMGAYYLSVLLFVMGQFVDYYLDITIVTNDRILDIEQKGIFGRQISELDLSRIQDVNSEIKGIIPTIFNFGLVEVQTAGEEAMFEFHDTPHPHRVRQRIIELAALDRKREAREMHAGGKTPEEDHHPLKEQGL